MTLLRVRVLREDVFVLPSTLVLCPYRMMLADFTQGRQFIILTGFTQEKKHLLYFSPGSRKLSVPQWCLRALYSALSPGLVGYAILGNEHLATFCLQDGLMGKDTVPSKVAGRAVHMTAGVHPPQSVLDSQDLWLWITESVLLHINVPFSNVVDHPAHR